MSFLSHFKKEDKETLRFNMLAEAEKAILSEDKRQIVRMVEAACELFQAGGPIEPMNVLVENYVDLFGYESYINPAVQCQANALKKKDADAGLRYRFDVLQTCRDNAERAVLFRELAHEAFKNEQNKNMVKTISLAALQSVAQIEDAATREKAFSRMTALVYTASGETEEQVRKIVGDMETPEKRIDVRLDIYRHIRRCDFEGTLISDCLADVELLPDGWDRAEAYEKIQGCMPKGMVSQETQEKLLSDWMTAVDTLEAPLDRQTGYQKILKKCVDVDVDVKLEQDVASRLMHVFSTMDRVDYPARLVLEGWNDLLEAATEKPAIYAKALDKVLDYCLRIEDGKQAAIAIMDIVQPSREKTEPWLDNKDTFDLCATMKMDALLAVAEKASDVTVLMPVALFVRENSANFWDAEKQTAYLEKAKTVFDKALEEKWGSDVQTEKAKDFVAGMMEAYPSETQRVERGFRKLIELHEDKGDLAATMRFYREAMEIVAGEEGDDLMRLVWGQMRDHGNRQGVSEAIVSVVKALDGDAHEAKTDVFTDYWRRVGKLETPLERLPWLASVHKATRPMNPLMEESSRRILDEVHALSGKGYSEALEAYMAMWHLEGVDPDVGPYSKELAAIYGKVKSPELTPPTKKEVSAFVGRFGKPKKFGRA